MSIILEYVDDLIQNSNQQQEPSFYEKHKGKILGTLGLAAGAGAYHFLGHHNTPHVDTPSAPVQSEPDSIAHKLKVSASKAWSDFNRPIHPSEMTQAHRLSQISQLEQHKSMHSDDMTNQEYENLNRKVDELKKYSNR